MKVKELLQMIFLAGFIIFPVLLNAQHQSKFNWTNAIFWVIALLALIFTFYQYLQRRRDTKQKKLDELETEMKFKQQKEYFENLIKELEQKITTEYEIRKKLEKNNDKMFDRFMRLFFQSLASQELNAHQQTLLQSLVKEAPQRKIELPEGCQVNYFS